MSKALLNTRFGKLLVINKTNLRKNSRIVWECICNCGNTKLVPSNYLLAGRTKSCGCFNIDNLKTIKTKHGHNKPNNRTKVYRIWAGMKNRCLNPNAEKYHLWGGRGITVCERWMKFENFLEDMGEPPSIYHSIDRIENNKGYYKENCRWATSKEQCRNTRKNVNITFNNKTQCLADWSIEVNIKSTIIRDRLKRGWSIENALTVPAKRSYLNAL